MKNSKHLISLLLSVVFLITLPGLSGCAENKSVQQQNSNSLIMNEDANTTLKGNTWAKIKIEPLARMGDWIYYMAPCNPHKWMQAQLYRVKIDGTGTEKVPINYRGQHYDLIFANGWIIYANSQDQGHLHKMLGDGSQDTQIGNQIRVWQGYKLRDGWLYYPADNNIYRTDINTNQETELSASYQLITKPTQRLSINEISHDWIYFTVTNEERNTNPQTLKLGQYTIYTNSLYRLKADGSQMNKIADNASNPFCAADWVYYKKDGDKTGAVYAVKADGTQNHLLCTNTQLKDPHVTEILARGSWVYYKVSYTPLKKNEVGAALFKVKPDGSGKTRLAADFNLEIYPDEYLIAVAAVKNYNRDGDWLYYCTRHDIYKMKIDGTRKQKIYSAGLKDIYWMELRGDYLFFNWCQYNSAMGGPVWRLRVKNDGTGFMKVEAP